MDKWFTLSDMCTLNGKTYSYLTSTNTISVHYNVLDMNFGIEGTLCYFLYSWRRRKEENITLVREHIDISIGLDEMFNIPLFKKIDEDDEIVKSSRIVAMINSNFEIKRALLEKYRDKICNALRNDERCTEHLDRFCGKDDLGDKTIIGDKDDDYGSIENIESCIVKMY